MKKIKEYFKGVRSEFKKIKWPTRKELFKYSLITIIFIILCSLFFLGIDMVMAYIRSVVK